MKQLDLSQTVYVGNLAFLTTEDQLRQHFSHAGTIKNFYMGLNKFKGTPCGFCFIEFNSRDAAVTASNSLDLLKMDYRQLKVKIDYGFIQGRQFGRGSCGYQRIDEIKWHN